MQTATLQNRPAFVDVLTDCSWPIAVFPTNCSRFNLYTLKQPFQRLLLPIHDDQLPHHLRLPMPLTHVRVASLGRLKVKAFKYTLNIRVVVDSDHHFAFAAMHEGGHAFVVSKREVDAAPCRLPAGGGPCNGTCAPGGSVQRIQPRQVFDIGPCRRCQAARLCARGGSLGWACRCDLRVRWPDGMLTHPVSAAPFYCVLEISLA